MYLKRLMIAATLLLAVGANAQQVKLSLAKGNKYEVTNTTKVTSVASVMGQEMESTASTSTTELVEVKDVSKKQIDLVSTITQMKVSAVAMGQETNFDSDKKDNTGPGAEEMGKGINKPRNITIDENGKVIKEDKDENAGVAASTMGVTEQSGLSLVKEGFIGKTITTGASWMDSTISNRDKITTKTAGTYTAKSIEGNIAVIGFDGITTVTGTMEQMGQEMEMKSSSKITMEIKLDIETGVILENTSTSTGDMTIEAAGMSIPVAVKTRSVVKTRKL